MACGCEGRQRGAQAFRTPAQSSDRKAVAAAVQPLYEVLNARGTSTGRKFTSLTQAEEVARTYGGSTRPL